jgi:hypothetical protein
MIVISQFTVDVSAAPDTANYTGTWDNGYYTLSLDLHDGTTNLWGSAYSLSDSHVNSTANTGSVEVNVGADLNNPYTITLSDQLQRGETATEMIIRPSGVEPANGTYHRSVLVKGGASVRSASTSSEVASAPSYAIGDTGPAGGVIFYDDEADGTDDITGARYLEAAPSDIEASGDHTHVWGGYRTAVGAAARGTAIGTGEANTAAIVAAYGASDPYNNTGDYAARLADQYAYGGYTDWFLPSQDELDLMYQNRTVVGGFASDWYWSSSEIGADTAWGQDFGTGSQFATNAGDTSDRVRAVRAF